MSRDIKIKYIVIDVDGTMTDGGIYYDENGNELKKFNTRDAAGFFAAKEAGINTVVLTGRKCVATERRMTELRVDYLFQNVKEKAPFLRQFMNEKGIMRHEIAYIGDDINDLESMKLVGIVGCPADACDEVFELADIKSTKKGGYGAVRDIIFKLLNTKK